MSTVPNFGFPFRRFCNMGTSSGPKGQFFLSALSCFGGGIILTTCFTHMLPEVNTDLRKNVEGGHFPKTGRIVKFIRNFYLMVTFSFVAAASRWSAYGRDSGTMWIFHDLHRGRGHTHGRA